ncbi:hypothetical protein EJ06DRAFT_529969 [Trichodelitschia bisporula]|uniref:Uncharacterized protein n=1 Tax=Trichodelitschia bisporula TaxID=703511 RepID=A0A6G1HYR0_9PEZI|nr:hypothetical protein EJ06DRAFT_529969 [Trichodelitschia bisporula]
MACNARQPPLLRWIRAATLCYAIIAIFMSEPLLKGITDLLDVCVESFNTVLVHWRAMGCGKPLDGQTLSDLKLETEELFMVLPDFLAELKDEQKATSQGWYDPVIDLLTRCTQSSKELHTRITGLEKRQGTLQDFAELRLAIEGFLKSHVELRSYIRLIERDTQSKSKDPVPSSRVGSTYPT